jgi:hypothetical protein
MPAVGERNVWAETTNIATEVTGTASFRWEKSVGLNIAF